jgi:thiol-disulfide isomerase/thioredoxin
MGALWVWLAGSGRIRLQATGDAPAAPDVTVDLSDGRRLRLADLAGRVVVLNAWASWCGPCRIEAPRLARLAHDMAEGGFVVVGLNTEGLPDDRLGELAEAWGMPYFVGRPDETIARRPLGPISMLPHTWIVDRAGRVRASVSGLVTEHALRDAVVRLLAESAEVSDARD